MNHRKRKFGLALICMLIGACMFIGGAFAQEIELRVETAGSSQPLMDEIVKRFEAEYPNIKVNATVSALEQYQVALLTQLAAGSAPDVMYVLPGGANPISYRQLAKAGYLLDLSDQPWVQRIPAGFKPGTQYDGKTVIYPVGQAMIGVLYNKEVFETNGVSVPRTYEEFLQACDTFQAAGIIPVVQGNLTPWVPQLINYAVVASTVYGPNPDYPEKRATGEVTFATTPGWLTAFNETSEMLDRGCFNDNPNGTTVDQMFQAVGTGKAAMAFMLTAALPRLAPFIEQGGSFGMFPFPAVNDPNKVYALAAPLNSYGVFSRTKHPEAAKAFIEFITRPEIIQLTVDATRDIPILKTEGVKLDPLLDLMLETVAAGRSAPSPDQTWPNSMVQQEHIAVTQEFFADRISAEDALKRMDRAYDQY